MKDSKINQNQTRMTFDKIKIYSSIEKIGEYKDNNISIKKWEDDEAIGNMFIIYIKNELLFLGIVNEFFQREGYCLNYYPNGDYYFGYFFEDERNKHGFYSYNPKNENDILISEYYFGLWKNDYREGHGIYLWLSENSKNEPFSNFELSNFEAFIGKSEKNIFKKGTLLTKKNEEYFVYHGTFSLNGKKDGDCCFYYSASEEMLLYGSFKDDNFINGFIANFDDDGILLKIIKFCDGEITEENKMDENEKNTNKKIMFNFRNIVMLKDYFGEIYEEFGKVLEFKNKYMSDIDILNSEKYIDIMNAMIRYNKIKIYDDIEKYVEN